MSKPRISFGQDENGQDRGWVAMSVAEHLRRARDPRFTAVVRIEHAALALMNKVQHAQLEPFQLADILGHDLEPEEHLVDAGWELLRPGRRLAGDSTIRKAIKDAIALGTLEPGSTRKCLIVPLTAQTRWQRRDSQCRVHSVGTRSL
jgi:hypothetical protein